MCGTCKYVISTLLYGIMILTLFEAVYSECEDGSWGANCDQSCNCLYETEVCNKTTGACPSGCKNGYEGIACDKKTVVEDAEDKKKGGGEGWKTGVGIGAAVVIMALAAAVAYGCSRWKAKSKPSEPGKAEDGFVPKPDSDRDLALRPYQHMPFDNVDDTQVAASKVTTPTPSGYVHYTGEQNPPLAGEGALHI